MKALHWRQHAEPPLHDVILVRDRGKACPPRAETARYG